MLTLLVVLHLFATHTFLIVEPNQQPAWKYQVENIDNEVRKLRKEIIEFEKKIVDAKKFPNEVADYEIKIEKLEKRIDDLSKQKELLLEVK